MWTAQQVFLCYLACSRTRSQSWRSNVTLECWLKKLTVACHTPSIPKLQTLSANQQCSTSGVYREGMGTEQALQSLCVQDCV